MLRYAYKVGIDAALEKFAVKVPFIHGTSGRWSVLRPGVGDPVLATDPNPRAVYTAMRDRRKFERGKGFAREAVAAKGGEPVIAHGKMDTRKGWLPTAMARGGSSPIESLDDAYDLIAALDAGVKEPRRGEIWRLLHKSTGSWRNSDLTATLKPTKYKPVR